MSETMPELASVLPAVLAHEAAEAAVREAMEQALPVGKYVEIPRGNGYLRGWVEGHGGSAYNLGSVYVELESTGNVVQCHIGHLIPGRWDPPTDATGEEVGDG